MLHTPSAPSVVKTSKTDVISHLKNLPTQHIEVIEPVTADNASKLLPLLKKLIALRDSVTLIVS